MGLLVKSEKLPSTNNEKKKSVTKTGVAVHSHSRSQDYDGMMMVKSQDPPNNYRETQVPSQPQAQMTLKNRIRAARKRGLNGDVQDLRYLVEEGPLSFRSFGFIGGFFMILASALDFVEDQAGGDFTPMTKLVTFYLWFCGLLTIQLEGRPFHFQITLVYNIICEFFNFLRFVWGRGFFYFFTGCIQFFLFTKYNMICGVFFMLLGVFSIIFGYRASVKLASLRNNITNKSEIKFLFHSFDRDRDGYLNSEEFREMLMAMDQGVDYNDFVAAMSAIDAGNNQKVSYHDLESWWESYTRIDLPPGTNIYRTISMQRYQSKTQPSNNHLMA